MALCQNDRYLVIPGKRKGCTVWHCLLSNVISRSFIPFLNPKGNVAFKITKPLYQNSIVIHSKSNGDFYIMFERIKGG